MTLPVFIRTSFVLCGLLGLRFNGIPNGRGGYTSIDTTIPIRIAGPNVIGLSKSTDLEINNMIPKKPSFPIADSVFMNKSQHSLKNTSSNSKDSFFDQNPKVYLYPKPIKTSSKQQPLPFKKSRCGPSVQCREDEICVTWVKGSGSKEKHPQMIYECRQNDGLHYNKMDPKQKLCDTDQTHSITYQSQPCLRENPSCALVWNYKCVNGTESSHNCKLRKCPSASCVEQIRCEEQPPCIIDAVCLPSYLIHA